MNDTTCTRYVVQFRALGTTGHWRDYSTSGGWFTETAARNNTPPHGENNQEYRLVKRVSTDTEI